MLFDKLHQGIWRFWSNLEKDIQNPIYVTLIRTVTTYTTNSYIGIKS